MVAGAVATAGLRPLHLPVSCAEIAKLLLQTDTAFEAAVQPLHTCEPINMIICSSNQPSA
jgi:hypothetical protein